MNKIVNYATTEICHQGKGGGENEKEEKIGKTEILVLNVMEWGGGGE